MTEGYEGGGYSEPSPAFAVEETREAVASRNRRVKFDRLVLGVERGEFVLEKFSVVTTEQTGFIQVGITLRRKWAPPAEGKVPAPRSPRRVKRSLKLPPKKKRELIFDDD